MQHNSKKPLRRAMHSAATRFLPMPRPEVAAGVERTGRMVSVRDGLNVPEYSLRCVVRGAGRWTRETA